MLSGSLINLLSLFIFVVVVYLALKDLNRVPALASDHILIFFKHRGCHFGLQLFVSLLAEDGADLEILDLGLAPLRDAYDLRIGLFNSDFETSLAGDVKALVKEDHLVHVIIRERFGAFDARE
jgi:hypothetical protein